MIKTVLALVGAASVVTTGAAAQTAPSQAQTYGFNAIARGDLNAAEARLIAQRAEEPNEPSVLLNLAYIYGRTGRADEATALYNQILASDDVLMVSGKGEQIGSHALARKAMNRTTGIASR